MATKKRGMEAEAHAGVDQRKAAYWYEKGVQDGRKQVADELVTLLGLDERFAEADHSHWRENEDN